jgi:RNA polymerase sigma-70 factor (ECF subfamily)
VRRDEEELRRVYRVHVTAVYAFFAYSVGREIAEDLTSATFERVIRSWQSYDASKASERTWILTICRNLLTDHHRRQQHRQATSLDEHPALVDTLVGPPDEYQRHLDRDEVRSWLAGLSEREREVLALRYGADLKAEDIGALTGLTGANVHQILSRTLRKLRSAADRPVS